MNFNDSALRVLVVDDNRDAADVTAELFTLQGHDALAAYDGAMAIDTARRFAPDVVFLDLGMPGVDGYQVAAALRLSPAFSRTRIVALTAWGDAASRSRTAASGFDAHLVKPASLDCLFDQALLAQSAH